MTDADGACKHDVRGSRREGQQCGKHGQGRTAGRAGSWKTICLPLAAPVLLAGVKAAVRNRTCAKKKGVSQGTALVWRSTPVRASSTPLAILLTYLAHMSLSCSAFGVWARAHRTQGSRLRMQGSRNLQWRPLRRTAHWGTCMCLRSHFHSLHGLGGSNFLHMRAI